METSDEADRGREFPPDLVRRILDLHLRGVARSASGPARTGLTSLGIARQLHVRVLDVVRVLHAECPVHTHGRRDPGGGT